MYTVCCPNLFFPFFIYFLFFVIGILCKMLIFMFKTFFFSWADKIDTKFCLKSTLVSWLNLELFYANDGIVFSFTISKIFLMKTKSISKKKKHIKKNRETKEIDIPLVLSWKWKLLLDHVYPSKTSIKLYVRTAVYIIRTAKLLSL